MKYRNGVTNLGVLCGFATRDAAGMLRVHQTACREMALTLTLAPGVRGPAFDYEPVTVVYRLEPGETAPTLHALHVTRMARHMLPKSFYWNSRDWPLNLDFYPFRTDKAGTLTEDLLASLADTHELPEWLQAAVSEDDALEDLLARPSSNKHLQNRLLITGFLTPGPIIAVPREESAHDYLRVYLQQPNDALKINLRMPPGTNGYHYLANGRCAPGGAAATVLAKPLIEIRCGADETVESTEFDLLLLEMNAVCQADLEATDLAAA